ncbi:MAG: hypothetical protein HRU01_08135 [Myxococcales bacterium]|nr:hypothetical protein [Myxococcales bacterium]
MAPPVSKSPTLRALANTAIGVGCGVLFFVMIEGLFSTWIALDTMFPQDRIAERLHTRHDPLLGWVNVPDREFPDFYGPGRDLSINPQGFRAARDVYPADPGDRIRMICSGDSFAMGYGVGNLDTWCHGLESRLEGLEGEAVETLNMGQGGYGVDQAYLWFRRDAGELGHSVHLFTFTTGDFERMLWDEFSGYLKPLLVTGDGGLVVANEPLPEPGIADTLRRTPFKLLAFRSVQGLFSFGKSLRDLDERRAIRSREQARVISLLFEDLVAINHRKSSALFAVLLPTEVEVTSGSASPERAHLRGELARLGVPFWDLTADFRRISRDDLASHFIPADDPLVRDFPGAPGHYNEKGNAFVADVLSARLRASGLLGNRGPAGS